MIPPGREPDRADEGGDDPFEARHDGPADDARVHDGIEHLQRAAHELIAASRSFLDVAEELLEDPRALGGLLGTIGDVGDLAARAVRAGFGAPGAARRAAGTDDDAWDDDHDADDDDPPVQRIPVS